MASKYTLTKGTKLFVSKAVADTINPTGATWLQLDCSMNEMSYTGGQKSDVEVTTLCSEEQEMKNGLASPGEVTLNGNWLVDDDDAQESIRDSYNNDTLKAYRLVLPSKKGYAFLAECRQENFSVPTGGKMTGGFTLRLKGKLIPYTEV